MAHTQANQESQPHMTDDLYEKEFLGKKPHTTGRFTDEGRMVFDEYRDSIKQVLENMPSQ